MFFFLRCGSLDDKRYEDTPLNTPKKRGLELAFQKETHTGLEVASLKLGYSNFNSPWLLGQHQDWKMDGPKILLAMNLT